MSTPVGNVPDYQDLVALVESPGEMATAADALLDDETRRAQIAERGWRLWRDRHTWEAIALRYEREYERLLSA